MSKFISQSSKTPQASSRFIHSGLTKAGNDQQKWLSTVQHPGRGRGHVGGQAGVQSGPRAQASCEASLRSLRRWQHGGSQHVQRVRHPAEVEEQKPKSENITNLPANDTSYPEKLLKMEKKSKMLTNLQRLWLKSMMLMNP